MTSTRRFKSALIPAVFSCLAIAKDARPGGGPGDYQALKEVPPFVLDYAPLVHLYSKESFWPSDIGEHLEHTVPFLNWTKIEGSMNQTVDNVGKLNQLDDGRWVYLKSEDEIDVGKDKYIKNLPTWLTSAHNKPARSEIDRDKKILNGSATEMDSQRVIIPEDDMDTWFDLGLSSFRPSAEEHAREFTIYGRKQKRSDRVRKSPLLPGRSSAPAVLLVVEKGEGVVDAFWFYFYSYNLGNSVFTFRFGNHVGDWEHSAVRFYRGVPKAVFLSQHAGGAVYTYSAVEKYGKRVSSFFVGGYKVRSNEAYTFFNLHIHSILYSWSLSTNTRAACALFCKRYPRDVCNTRSSTVCSTLPHSPRYHRPWPSLGSINESLRLPLQHNSCRWL